MEGPHTTLPTVLAKARFEEWEQQLHAFACVAASGFEQLQSGGGSLAGLALGVKDIIDVEGLRTGNGSAVFDLAQPASRDAAVVGRLRAAGAAILGKTTTTEFAFTDPTSTTNPYDLRHTPGGSSAGSGAAVGAGILDLAIATQTAGSLCRPAAYCGAVGFKPSFGHLPLDGVTPLSPSFDTVGVIARDVATADLAFAIAGGRDQLSGSPLTDCLRIGLAQADPMAPMTAASLDALTQCGDALATLGHRISTTCSPMPLRDVVAWHRTVMLHEAAILHGHLLFEALSRLRPNFAAALREGGTISVREAAVAGQNIANGRERFWSAMSGFDFLVAPPVPSSAPRRDGTTGYQNLLTPWTAFHGPLLVMPWGLDAGGLPLSVMLAGPPNSDDRLLALGRALEPLAPHTPRPILPLRSQA